MRVRKLRIAVLVCAMVSAALLAAVASAPAAEPNVLPEGTEKEPLTSTGESAGGVLFKFERNKLMECTSAPGTGEMTSGKLGLLVIELLGCKDPSLKVGCEGLAINEPAEHIKVHAVFHVWRGRLVTKGGEAKLHPAVLVLLLLHVHFTCGGLVLFLMLGCIAGLLNPVKKPTKELEVKFLENEKAEGINDITEVENEENKFIPCGATAAEDEGVETHEAVMIGTWKLKAIKRAGKEVEAEVMA